MSMFSSGDFERMERAGLWLLIVSLAVAAIIGGFVTLVVQHGCSTHPLVLEKR